MDKKQAMDRKARKGKAIRASDAASGHDWRYCSECGHEYDALAGKCPFCAEGQPAEFKK